MATISEVAQLLVCNRDTIKQWTTDFAEYLSLTANPGKGIERHFNESDLRVLALVAEHWEDEPDYENIYAMLNTGEHNQDRLVLFARLHTPIFQEVSNEIDETWQHGVLIGGMADRNLLQVAESYKKAADKLVNHALSHGEAHELDYPIIFLYRHSIELYLKVMLNAPPAIHDLSKLIVLLENQFGNQIAGWIKARLRDFHLIDQQSDLFRYSQSIPNGELWIDFHQLQTVVDRLVSAFETQIKHRK